MPFRRMPPLLALRAFEAVARHGSFKRAADELNVTPGALSQQVRKLEQDLDVTLFVRHNRAIEPTEAGHRLRAGLTDAFVRMREAVEAVKPADETSTLVVACGPPFAAKWLVPRLGRLLEQHPELDIRIAAAFGRLDYGPNEIDVGVRLGLTEDEALDHDPLVEESVLPLASPAFIEKQALREPRDLLRVPLLSDESIRFFHDATPTWATWFEAVCMDPADATRGVSFGRHGEQAIDAAAAGAGVVLGRRVLASMDMAQGRLVSPFGPELGAGLTYKLAHRRQQRLPSKVALFKRWLLEELEACLESKAFRPETDPVPAQD